MWDGLAVLAIAVGAALRLREFLPGSALWLDETMLALNILGRSCHEYFGALAFDQSAGPLYLCLSRALAVSLGGREIGLRMVPLLAGIALLVLVWRVGRQLIGREAAAWATWLLAVSPFAIVYSNEVKPYILDAAACALLVWCGWRALHAPAGPARAAALVVAGLLAILTSLTAPFVLAALGIVLWSDGVLRRSRFHQRQAFGVSLAWLGCFAILYQVVYRPGESAPFLSTFWQHAFPSAAVGWQASIVNAVTQLSAALPLPEELMRARYLLPASLILVAIVGVADRQMATLLGLPVGLLLVASWFRLYPIADRLVLFTAPLVVWGAGFGITELGRRIAPGRTALRFGVTAALIGTLGASALSAPLPWPGGTRDARDAMAMVEHTVGDDPLLVMGPAVPVWLYYTTNWTQPDLERLRWFERRPSFQSGLFHATGTTPPDPPLQVRPGGPARRLEMVPSPSGVGVRPGGRSELVFSGWAAAQIDELHRLALPVVWVLAIHPAEAEALSAAWRGRGGAVRESVIPGTGRLLRLSHAW